MENNSTTTTTQCHHLTFRTIDKNYTNNYTDKCIEFVPSKPTTTSMKEKGIDKYANAQTTIRTQTTR